MKPPPPYPPFSKGGVFVAANLPPLKKGGRGDFSRFWRSNLLLGLTIGIIVIISDQLSKWLVLQIFHVTGENIWSLVGSRMEMLPFLDCLLRWNRGVSFSMGTSIGNYSQIFFALFSVAISIFLLVWMHRANSRWIVCSLGLVVGGAIGNTVDRIRFGAVEDFLYVHIGVFDWWPVFNVADSAICVGAAFLFFEALFTGQTSVKKGS